MVQRTHPSCARSILRTIVAPYGANTSILYRWLNTYNGHICCHSIVKRRNISAQAPRRLHQFAEGAVDSIDALTTIPRVLTAQQEHVDLSFPSDEICMYTLVWRACQRVTPASFNHYRGSERDGRTLTDMAQIVLSLDMNRNHFSIRRPKPRERKGEVRVIVYCRPDKSSIEEGCM